MKALSFWKAVTLDKSNLLEEVFALLRDHGVRFCVIGGQAVNAYVEPLVGLDLDLVVAVDQIGQLDGLMRKHFHVEAFPHSLNISSAGSNLRVQFRTDPRYDGFVERASIRDVLGLQLPVASIEDVLAEQVWTGSRRSLLDIERLLEVYPALKSRVPGEIIRQLG
jgi:hypothetical protein